MFLTSNHCFRPKYESLIHIIAFSSEKAISSESAEKYAQIKQYLKAKKEDNRGQTFSLIMDYELVFWPEVTV